jgi:hypothetical protein
VEAAELLNRFPNHMFELTILYAVLQLGPVNCQQDFLSSMLLLVLGSSIFPRHLIKQEEL